MSFTWPPVGLHKLPSRSDGSGSYAIATRIRDLAGQGSRACLNYYGQLVQCPGPAAGIGEFSVALADVPFFTGADYFSVRCWVEGPVLGGADCVEPFAPTVSPCGTFGLASYDGVISPTPWVKATGGEPGHVDQSPEYTATNAGEGFGAQVDWPPNAGLDVAFLVNPVPVWPAPDAHGNDFGMVLFTLAQLPGAVSTVISYSSWNNPVGGRLWVGVIAFTLEDPGPGGGGGAQRGSLIGHA